MIALPTKRPAMKQELDNTGIFRERCGIRMRTELEELGRRVLALRCTTMHLVKLIDG